MVRTMWCRAVIAAAALVFGAAPALAGGEGKKATYGSDFSGRHTMEGEVTRIDQAKGILSLKTAEGTMDLHFPPSALANIKKGDRVAVELALKPTAGPSASPRSERTPTTKK